MAHGFLLERQALRSPPLATPGCPGEPHSVLAPFSRRYPQLKDRLPMHYSPFRHSHSNCIATAADPVRLACLIHATSVRSEPESNSQKKNTRQPDLRPADVLFGSITYTSHSNRIPSKSKGRLNYSDFKEPTSEPQLRLWFQRRFEKISKPLRVVNRFNAKKIPRPCRTLADGYTRFVST